MKFYSFSIAVILLVFASCRKLDPIDVPKVPPIGDTLQVKFKLNGTDYQQVLGVDVYNSISGLNTEVSPGVFHLSRGALFPFTTWTIDLQFANIKGGSPTTDTIGLFQSLKQLCTVGAKNYDSIYNRTQLNNDGIEIKLKDNDGSLWCSTKLTKVNDTYYSKSVSQAGSNFNINSVREYSSTGVGNRPNALIIKGNFSCTLYEIDGTRMKALTNGTFIIILAP